MCFGEWTKRGGAVRCGKWDRRRRHGRLESRLKHRGIGRRQQAPGGGQHVRQAIARHEAAANRRHASGSIQRGRKEGPVGNIQQNKRQAARSRHQAANSRRFEADCIDPLADSAQPPTHSIQQTAANKQQSVASRIAVGCEGESAERGRLRALP